MMNWDALGAIGELVGAVAVIVTLVYIAAQVRENTKSLKGFSVDSALNASLNVTSDLTGDAELGQLWASGMEAWDGLDERKRTRLIFMLFRYFKCLESLHYQYSKGILEEELWIGWRTQLAEYANTPAGKAFLAVRRTWYAPQFIALIESLPTTVTHVSAANLASRSSE